MVSEVRESGIYDDTELLDVVAPKINQEMDVMVLNDADRTAKFINLRLIGQDDSEYQFRRRLSDDSSPQSRDMENNDIIEVFHAM